MTFSGRRRLEEMQYQMYRGLFLVQWHRTTSGAFGKNSLVNIFKPSSPKPGLLSMTHKTTVSREKADTRVTSVSTADG